ncbi:holin family protein [Amylibacter sp.]|nr:holin family protein [Amylibacter sp.]
MIGLDTVPRELWWLLAAIVSFYFGARELHYVRDQRAARGTRNVAPQSVAHVDTEETQPLQIGRKHNQTDKLARLHARIIELLQLSRVLYAISNTLRQLHDCRNRPLRRSSRLCHCNGPIVDPIDWRTKKLGRVDAPWR